jgi:hypothetical protein
MTALPHPESDVLDRSIRESTIVELFRAGLLTAQARNIALAKAERTRHWWRWADRGLLFTGSALVLSVAVFFFAYNWSHMHAIGKFSVIEVGLWLCALGSMQRGLDKIAGKVMLLAASVFVGVLLAVYGQVYQTGADNWRLYAVWSVLILPWTIIGRFAALWVLWLAVTNAAWLLCWFQSMPPEGFHFEFGVFLFLAGWNGGALALREQALPLKVEWISSSWVRHTIWLSVLVYLLIPTLFWIIQPESDYGFGSRPLLFPTQTARFDLPGNERTRCVDCGTYAYRQGIV